jgi:hypothetical protein
MKDAADATRTMERACGDVGKKFGGGGENEEEEKK